MADSMKVTLNYFLGLTWAILALLGYIQLSQFISACLEIYLSQDILGHLGLSLSSIRVYVELGDNKLLLYRPSGEGALTHCLQCRNVCEIQNCRQGPQNGQRKGVFWRFGQLSLNKLFDPSTPSMRKGRDGENGKKRWKKIDNDVYSGH